MKPLRISPSDSRTNTGLRSWITLIDSICRVASEYIMIAPTSAMIAAYSTVRMRTILNTDGSPALAALDVEVGVVGDQSRRTADLRHHGVAGVDAQPALDAAEVRAVADVDAGRADVDALVAVDAVARGLALRPQHGVALHRAARLAAVVAVGDVERVFVGQRGLDARPRTHVEADLFAHQAGEACRS